MSTDRREKIMKIVIAPDSFKENLTSLEVATAIERGIRRVLPKARCVKIPMADGGEGTVQSLVDATAGRLLRKRVRGPRGEPVSARYGILGDGETAVIEMAEASGLPLIPRAERNPLETTTYGTGELIVDAIARGIKSIIIGIGGSATVDCGTGMAQALGVKFIDANGKEITTLCSGGMLDQIAKIDMSGLDPRVRKTRIIIASDVDNPLYGRRGAAYVFGPQKGATPEMVKLLDSNLRHAAAVIKARLRHRRRQVQGRRRRRRIRGRAGYFCPGADETRRGSGDRSDATEALLAETRIWSLPARGGSIFRPRSARRRQESRRRPSNSGCPWWPSAGGLRTMLGGSIPTASMPSKPGPRARWISRRPCVSRGRTGERGWAA